MDISFELYKVFYHVAKSLSFSLAAQELYISQSAVSQSIKTLEEKLSAQLFVRHTKQVKLTQEGKALLNHVEQAYHLLKAGERSISGIQGLQQGQVTIAASDTTCKYFLLPFIKEFHQAYPHIKIQIINRPSPVCIELLRSTTVDVAVVNMSDNKKDNDLQVHMLKEIQDVFIAGNSFHYLKNKKVSIKELEKYPFLLLEKNSTTRNFFDALLQKYNVNIQPEVELGSMDLIVELVKIGLGISFVMEEVIQKEILGTEIFPLILKEEIPRRKLGIVTNNHLPIPIAAEKFIDLLSIRVSQ